MKSLSYLIRKYRVVLQIMVGRRAGALQDLESLLQDHPDDSYALASRAHLRAQDQDRLGALRDYARLTATPDAKAAHWFNQGFLQDELKQFDAAEASFRRAIEIDPELDRAWYGLGLVLIQLQRFDEAIAALRRNTQLQPMSPYAWYQLARVHMDRQEPDETAKIIRHLKGFEPKIAAQLERETGLKST